jgi:hypothetical protein
MLLAQTAACLNQAVASLVFPQSAWNIEITFAVAVSDLPVPAVAPAPQPQPAPVYGAVQPQPAPPPQPQQDWRPLYQSGRRKVIAGGVLTGLGLAFLLGGAGWAAIEANRETDPDYPTGGMTGGEIASTLLILGGIGLTIPGIIVLAIGKRRIRQANAIKAGIAGLAPVPSMGLVRGGAALQLTWTF